MNRSEELQQRRDKVDADRVKKLEEIEREERILTLLPETVALPRHCFTGSKLYGMQALLSYGDSYSRSDNKYSLAEALELVDSISADAVDIYTVKDSCLSIKPKHAVTEQERERATINGPFYGMKIQREVDHANLIAVVMLQKEQIELKIALKSPHNFGSWRIESDTNYGARPYRGHNPEYEGRYVKQPATIGQAKTVQYGGGSYRGRGSAGQMIYLFDCREALQGYADTLMRREDEREATQL